ncbi:hypothetical protein QJS04_geneDACA001006 [Acorus gramineus]|uniref:Uncharacterized protein n=1 Tax=Acorus gramineus TaxID=55184 RepID=A0AAV9ABG0_ACOGR|nr:hypothetical protein QJS04_geneDACA001006 [Acorus gramineus]
MQNDGTNAEEDGRRSDGGDGGTAETAAVVQIVIVQPQPPPPPPPEAEAVVAVSENSAVKAGALGGAVSEKDEKAKKVCLSRSESYNEQCSFYTS